MIHLGNQQREMGANLPKQDFLIFFPQRLLKYWSPRNLINDIARKWEAAMNTDTL